MPGHAVITQVLPAPAASVFEVLHDYPRRLEWDTLLSEAYLVDADAAAQGVEAVCTARKSLGGISFHTRYVTFRPPAPGVDGLAAVTLMRPTAMFSAWAASIRHRELTPGVSNVTYTLSFTCRPRALAAIIEPAATQAFTLETHKRLAALAEYLAPSPGVS